MIQQLILILVLSSFTHYTYSQIVFEANYPYSNDGLNHVNYMVGKIKLNENKTKYLCADYYVMDNQSYNVQYKIYNLNHSVYKILPIIEDTLQYGVYSKPISIQENLFNLDSIIEIAYFKFKGGGISGFKVINEFGEQIFERDSVSSINFSSALTQEDGFFNSEQGVKLMLSIGESNELRSKEVYSLGGVIINAIPPDNEDDEFLSLFPNPSRDYTRILYSLPNGVAAGEIIVYDLHGWEVKRFEIDGMFKDLLLSNSDLQSGSYYYCLVAEGKALTTKKSIVIK